MSLKNYRIRQSLNTIRLIETEFASIDFKDKYYLANMGIKRTLSRISTYNDILAGTNFTEGAIPIWQTH
jgi:hypothetical protein